MEQQTTVISAIESLLFISGEPLSFARIAKVIGSNEDEVRNTVKNLAEKYAGDTGCGLMIVMQPESAVLATKPEHAASVEAFTRGELQETLSKAALEVLSIIAYRAPISRAEIDAIRGVNCSFTLRNLLLRDLIERSGNPQDTRGYIYRPSFRFLETLGLGSIQELPDFESLSKDERLEMVLAEASIAPVSLAEEQGADAGVVNNEEKIDA
jgi:segregation and condensation protein B